MADDLDSRLRKVFVALLRVDPSLLHDDARRGELEGWDSMAHLDLVAELEREFSLQIEPEQALEIETFADARRVVSQLAGG